MNRVETTDKLALAERVEAATDEQRPKRTVESLSRLEKLWLKCRHCSFCEAPMLGSLCYAHSGEYELPVIEGVRDKPEIVDLGPACDMDERRASALTRYRPRSHGSGGEG